jgi:hypothetical protein
LHIKSQQGCRNRNRYAVAGAGTGMTSGGGPLGMPSADCNCTLPLPHKAASNQQSQLTVASRQELVQRQVEAADLRGLEPREGAAVGPSQVGGHLGEARVAHAHNGPSLGLQGQPERDVMQGQQQTKERKKERPTPVARRTLRGPSQARATEAANQISVVLID